MEAVPKLPLLFLPLKTSEEPTDLAGNVVHFKQYIRAFYNEDPEAYNKEIRDLEVLRQAACRVPRDFTGCSTLKKYYAQLQLLQSRFPLKEGSKSSIYFTWNDVYTKIPHGYHLKNEQASILHNIGALHSELGAIDSRQTSEGMKISCTHFQCAAWAFQNLRDNFHDTPGCDMAPELLLFYVNLMLGQAQECILEKSMLDNRKSTIVAKIAAQIVEYYRLALKTLEGSNSGSKSPDNIPISGIVGSQLYKSWKKYLEFKSAYHTCLTYLYMGNQAEELQKMGERVTYYQAAMDKLTESVKLAKGLDKDVGEALTFTMDIVGGKLNGASKENDFVYHEKVPTIDSLPEVKGASLVKGIPFDPADLEISGPDIFARLVPMEAHKASSMYSEEKAKLLRQIGTSVAEKDQELMSYLSSLQLDQLQLNPEPDRLPQDLVDCCAAMSVRPTAIKELIVAMQNLSGMFHDVDSVLQDAEAVLEEEEKQEKEYSSAGSRPPSMIILDIKKELSKYQEAHQKASESNVTLHKAMDYHIANLNLLSGSLEELEKVLPSVNLIEAPVDDAGQYMQRLVGKVETMQAQRHMLESQLREEIQADDITKQLVTMEDQNLQDLFAQEIRKHDRNVGILNQNLAAQENILKALTEANARYADTRKATYEITQRRQNMIHSLIASYEAYEDLVSKSQKGLDFYRKLETSASKLLQRARSVCKVQQEEREKLVEKQISKAAPKPLPTKFASPSHGGPKLKDYLLANTGGKDSGAAGGGGQATQPTPFAISDTASMSEITETLKSMLDSGGGHGGYYTASQPEQRRSPMIPPRDSRSNLVAYPPDAETYVASGGIPYTSVPTELRPAPVGSEQTDVPASSYHQVDVNRRNVVDVNLDAKDAAYRQAAAYRVQRHAEELYHYQQHQQQQPQHSNLSNFGSTTAMYRETDNFKLAQQRADMTGDGYYGKLDPGRYPTTDIPTNVGSYLQYPASAQQQQQHYVRTSLASPSHELATPPPAPMSYYNSSGGQGVNQAPPPTSGHFPHGGAGRETYEMSPAGNGYSSASPSPVHSVVGAGVPVGMEPGYVQYPSAISNAAYASSGSGSTNHHQMSQQQPHHYPPPSGFAARDTSSPSYSSIYSSAYASASTISQSATSGGQQVSSTTAYRPQSTEQPSASGGYFAQQQPPYGAMSASGSVDNSQSSGYYSQQTGHQNTTASAYQYPQNQLPQPYQQQQQQQDQNKLQLQQHQYQFQQQQQLQLEQQQQLQIEQQQQLQLKQQQQLQLEQQQLQQQQQQQLQQQQQQYLQLQQSQSEITGNAVPNYYMPSQQPLQPQTVGTPTSTYTQSNNLKPPVVDPTPVQQPPPQQTFVAKSNLDLLTEVLTPNSPTPVIASSAAAILVPKQAPAKTHSEKPAASIGQPINHAVVPLAEAPPTITVPIPKPQTVTGLVPDKPQQPQRKDESSTRRVLRDPFSDKEAQVKFAVEVDRFQKVVEGLCKQSLNGPTPLDQKWKELMDAQDRESRKLSISVARCYSLKNRVPDIMPYDSNRVKLASTRDDYVNASHVVGLSRNTAAYIATQAPLPSTYGDFWTMVFEQQVEVVAILITDAELKGDVYWPTEKGQVSAFGVMTVSLQSCRTKPWGLERVVTVTQRETRNSRVVMHLQFTEWPPGGIPSSPAQFLHFVSDVQSYHRDQRSLAHPIVVHCSTGVGRTGVLCVVSAAMHEINAGNGIADAWSLAATMTRIRKYAMQDKEHMRFALHAVLYFAEDCLLKCGILIKRASFDDKVAGAGCLKKSSHIRHPSQDFILNAGHDEQMVSATTNGSGVTAASNTTTTNTKNATTSLDRDDASTTSDPATGATRSRSNSSASVASVASSASSSRPPQSPRHEPAPTPPPAGGTLPPSLALLDAANFSLDPPSTGAKGRKITRESFNTGAVGGLLDKQQASANPDDPLSQLDPLWTLHK